MTESTITFEGSDSFEDGATFRATENGGIRVAVAEEQAMDSYNSMFECTIHLSAEQAAELRDWICAMFPADENS